MSFLRLDEEGIARGLPDGTTESLRWDQLHEAGYLTTDEGPFEEDVYYLFRGSDGSGVAVPLSLSVQADLTEYVNTLPGFDDEVFLSAMTSVDNQVFVAWKRPEGHTGLPWAENPFASRALLRKRFHESVAALGGAADDELYRRVTNPYYELNRHYHSIRHLEKVVEAIELLKSECENLHVTRLAGFYHDVVYTGKPGDEEASARFASDELRKAGVSQKYVEQIAALVQATKTHAPADSGNAKVLFDADLSIFGAERPAYLRYAAGVREEYVRIPGFIFRWKRNKILRSFLKRERIYHTTLGRAQWEEKARENIEAELS